MITYDANVNPHFKGLTRVVRTQPANVGIDTVTASFLASVLSKVEKPKIDVEEVKKGFAVVNDKIKSVSESYGLTVPVIYDSPPIDEDDEIEFYSTAQRVEDPIPERKDRTEFHQLVKYFSADAVRKRLNKREFVSYYTDTPFQYVDPSLTDYMSVDNNWLRRPKERMGETNAGEIRYSAVSKFLSDADPVVIYSILADGGGGIKSYSSSCPSLTTIVLMQFDDYKLARSTIERYKGFLAKDRPGVDVVVEKFAFRLKDIHLHVNAVSDSVVKYTGQRIALLYNFCPVVQSIIGLFTASYGHFKRVADIDGSYSRVELPDINSNYAIDTVSLNLYFSLYDNDQSVDYVKRYYDEKRREIATYVHHSFFRELVCVEDFPDYFTGYTVFKGKVRDYVGRHDVVMNYDCYVTHRDDGFGIDLVHVPLIADSVELVDMTISYFDVECAFVSVKGRIVNVSEKMVSSLSRVFDDGRVYLPKKTVYVCIEHEGFLWFIDYVDSSKTFLQRRALLQRCSLPVVKLYSHCVENVMMPVILSSSFVNFNFVVTRDILLGIVDLDIIGSMPELSIVSGQVSLCSMHGFVHDDIGLLCISDTDILIPSNCDRSIREAYNLDIGRNFFAIPEVEGVVITRKKCDGFCIPYDISTLPIHRGMDALVRYQL
jgi:hypothetical protein